MRHKVVVVLAGFRCILFNGKGQIRFADPPSEKASDWPLFLAIACISDVEKAMRLHDSAVYTTIAPERLFEAENGEAPSREISVGRRWVSAQRMLEDATRAGATLPVLFSDARDCVDLIYWARVTSLRVKDERTYITFSHLTALHGHRVRELELLKQRRHIAVNFIRSYALVATPHFLKDTTIGMNSEAIPEPTEPTHSSIHFTLDTGASRHAASDHLATMKAVSGEDDPPLVLYSWGYDGWGNSIKYLLQITKVGEGLRGYEPPVFVDVRFRRSGRAMGFREAAFEGALPPDRHRWMKDLGNENVGEDDERIKIHRPKAAADLLDLALTERRNHRRVIFFCHCRFPDICHRSEVRKLVLKIAKKRGLHLSVAEWPGGEPADHTGLHLTVTQEVFTKTFRGAKSIPVPESAAIDRFAALPWGTVVTLSDGTRHGEVSLGPAKHRGGHWFLPIFVQPAKEDDTAERLAEAAQEARTEKQYKIYSPR